MEKGNKKLRIQPCKEIAVFKTMIVGEVGEIVNELKDVQKTMALVLIGTLELDTKNLVSTTLRWLAKLATRDKRTR